MNSAATVRRAVQRATAIAARSRGIRLRRVGAGAGIFGIIVAVVRDEALGEVKGFGATGALGII